VQNPPVAGVLREGVEPACVGDLPVGVGDAGFGLRRFALEDGEDPPGFVAVRAERDLAEDAQSLVVDVDTALLVEFAPGTLSEALVGVDFAAREDPGVYRGLLDQQYLAGGSVGDRVGAEGQPLPFDAPGDGAKARPRDASGGIVAEEVLVGFPQAVGELFGLLARLAGEIPEVVDGGHDRSGPLGAEWRRRLAVGTLREVLANAVMPRRSWVDGISLEPVLARSGRITPFLSGGRESGSMAFEEDDRVILHDEHSDYDGEEGTVTQVVETMFGDENYIVSFEDGQEAGIPEDNLEAAPEDEDEGDDGDDADEE
jgi:hypothetical protein